MACGSVNSNAEDFFASYLLRNCRKWVSNWQTLSAKFAKRVDLIMNGWSIIACTWKQAFHQENWYLNSLTNFLDRNISWKQLEANLFAQKNASEATDKRDKSPAVWTMRLAADGGCCVLTALFGRRDVILIQEAFQTQDVHAALWRGYIASSPERWGHISQCRLWVLKCQKSFRRGFVFSMSLAKWCRMSVRVKSPSDIDRV